MMTHLFPNCRKGPSILENLGKWQWAVNTLQVLILGQDFAVLNCKTINFKNWYSFMKFFAPFIIIYSPKFKQILHYLFSKKLSKFLRLKPTVEMARFLPLQWCFNLLELENYSRCQNNFKSRRYINLQSNSGTSAETNMSGGLCLVNP